MLVNDGETVSEQGVWCLNLGMY